MPASAAPSWPAGRALAPTTRCSSNSSCRQRSPEHRPPDLEIRLALPVPREPLLDPPASLPSHRDAALGLLEQLGDGVSESTDVARRLQCGGWAGDISGLQ